MLINHRVTFIHPETDHFLEADIASDGTLSLPLAAYPRQDRYRLLATEAPPAVQPFLAHVTELRIQWASYAAYTPDRIFLERVPPGLHVHFTATSPEAYAGVSQWVERLFGVDVAEANYTLSTSASFFHPMKVLPLAFAAEMERLVRKPQGSLASLVLADTVSLGYTATTKQVVFLSYYSDSDLMAAGSGARANVFKPTPETRTEIGIFSIDVDASTLDDYTLHGVRYTVGGLVEPTFLHVAPRHRTVPVEFEVEVGPGLHPAISLAFNTSLISPETLFKGLDTSQEHGTDSATAIPSRCSLFAYFVLPKAVFFDQYQVGEGSTMAGLWGATDLEAPEYAVSQWGSELLLELEPERLVTVTLHSRYQLPEDMAVAQGPLVGKQGLALGLAERGLPVPLVFYACDPREPLGGSPFDSKGLGYESFFTANTVLYHLHPAQAHLEVPIAIPTMVGSSAVVGAVVSGAVIGLLLYLGWKFALIWRRNRAVAGLKKAQ